MYERLREAIASRDAAAGISAAELLDLPDDLRRLLQILMREGDASVADLAAASGTGETDVAAALESLESKGLVKRVDGADRPRYRAVLAQRRGREVPAGIWVALAAKLDRASGSRG